MNTEIRNMPFTEKLRLHDEEINKIPLEHHILLSFENYAEKLGQTRTVIRSQEGDKRKLHAELIRQGVIENLFDLNIKNLTPLYFRNQKVKNEIVVPKSKKNLPTNIRRISFEESLRVNEKEEFKKLRKALNNDEITPTDFYKSLFKIRSNNVLTCMEVSSYTIDGTLKALKSYKNRRDFCMDYEDKYFRSQNPENHQILEKTTTKTATLTEEVKETKILPS